MNLLSVPFIVATLSLINCNDKFFLEDDNKLKEFAENTIDTSQVDFNSFLKGLENEEIIKREILSSFLPDSVISKIPAKHVLFLKYKIMLTDNIILKMNSNGDSNGDLFLFSFTRTGVLIDYWVVQRYCDANCSNIGLAKEIVITNDTNGFEFEVIETENVNPGSKPLFLDDQEYKKENWKLNEQGKFVIKIE